MLEQFFLHILEISFQASILIAAIILVRLCFKRIPRQFICAFWMLAAIRLILPFQITSEFSLVPDTSIIQDLSEVTYSASDQDTPNVSNGTNIEYTDISITDTPNIPSIPMVSENDSNTVVTDFSEETKVSFSLTDILSRLWLVVGASFILYGIISYLRIKRTLKEAVYDRDNIWYSERIPSPFVMGYLKPRIYIPYGTDASQLPYIIAHEQAHISHLDHIGKLVGYLLLCIYWFNPLVWIAYILYCRDLELACDERVLKKLGTSQKKFYSTALLNCSVTNKSFLQSPLAFSEVAIKERIKHILNYKKPGFWVMALVVLIAAIYCVCFMTNAVSEDTSADTLPNAKIYTADEVYTTKDEWLKEIETYWLTRLTAEQKLAKTDKMYCFSVYEPSDIIYMDINRTNGLESGKPVEMLYYFYILDEHHICTVYSTVATITKETTGYRVTKYVHTPFDEITTAETAAAAPVFYGTYGLGDTKETRKKLGECVRDSFVKQMIDSKLPEKSYLVTSPDNALETLMHLSGGTAEVFSGENDSHKYVLYTFADNTQVGYQMTRISDNIPPTDIGQFWYPVGLVTLDTIENARRTENFINQVTIEDLTSVALTYNHHDDYYKEMPKKISFEAFRILDELPEKDITLYTLLDASAMVLRDGDTLYPIFYNWGSGHLDYLPKIYKNDYDHDGVEEYALLSADVVGTDSEIMMLSMLEPDNGSLIMRRFLTENMLYQLKGMINYVYKDNALNISTYNSNALLDVSFWNDKFDTTYNQLHFGDWVWFEERDGQWWIIANAYVQNEDASSRLNDSGAVFSGPIDYFTDKYYQIEYLEIELVDNRSSFDNQNILLEQAENFPGNLRGQEDGTYVAQITLQDHECTTATKSDTHEQIYFWSKNTTSSSSGLIKSYPVEFIDGVLQDVPAKVITEDDILKYPFGQSLLQTVRLVHPYGIKQYILRDNGTLHVNVGYEDDKKTFLTLEYLTFELSKNMQSATLTGNGVGYYLLGINNPESLEVFRKDFTGEGHFLPDDTSQLPWKWLLELNGETVYDTTISVENVPVIPHMPNYYAYTDMNVASLSSYSSTKGFTFSEIWNNGKAFAELRYLSPEDDLIILFDDTDTAVSVTYNGEKKNIPDNFIELPYAYYYSSGPAMMDVDGDDQKEFIDIWWSRGTGYLPEGCEVYRLDTPDLEKIPFDTDISEITKDVDFQIIENSDYDEDSGLITFSFKYEDQYGEGTALFNYNRLPVPYKSDMSLEELTKYVGYIPYENTVNIYLNDDVFEMGVMLQIDAASVVTYLGKLTAQYVYDNVSERFVIDKNTVKLEVYP